MVVPSGLSDSLNLPGILGLAGAGKFSHAEGDDTAAAVGSGGGSDGSDHSG